MHCLLTNFGGSFFNHQSGTKEAQDKMLAKGGKDYELATAIRVCFNRGVERVLGWYEGEGRGGVSASTRTVLTVLPHLGAPFLSSSLMYSSNPSHCDIGVRVVQYLFCHFHFSTFSAL